MQKQVFDCQTGQTTLTDMTAAEQATLSAVSIPELVHAHPMSARAAQ